MTFLPCDPGWYVQNKWDDNTHTPTHTWTNRYGCQSCSWSLEPGNIFFLSPFAPENLASRYTRYRLILHTQAESGAYSYSRIDLLPFFLPLLPSSPSFLPSSPSFLSFLSSFCFFSAMMTASIIYHTVNRNHTPSSIQFDKVIPELLVSHAICSRWRSLPRHHHRFNSIRSSPSYLCHTQFAAVGVHCRESAGTRPVALRVARISGAAC